MARGSALFILIAGLLLGAAALGFRLTQSAQSTAPGAIASRPSSQPDSQPASQPTVCDFVATPQIAAGEEALPNLRILCGAPNVSEICCALGLRDRIVGRTRFCTYPPSILNVPSIGALIDANVETVVALKPDLVLISGESRGMTERLAPLGLNLESVPDRSLADLFSAIRRIGDLTGRVRTARLLCENIEQDMERVQRRCATQRPMRVLLVTGTLGTPPTPPFVAGPGSFYHDLLKRAGYIDAAPDEGRAFGTLALEAVLKANPDVILELDPDGTSRPRGDADARQAWAPLDAVAAVRNRRVYVLTGPEHFLLGPRVALTLQAICRAVAGTTP